MSRFRSFMRAATGVLFAAGVACLVGFKFGWVKTRPVVLAATFGATALLACVCAVEAAFRLSRAPRRVSTLAEVFAAAGLALATTGGLANWAFSYQGFVLIGEREPVRLARSGDAVDIQAGPLADRRELDMTVALAKLQLLGSGPGHFRAVSRLRVLDSAGEEVGISVERGVAARVRNVVFHQGAFGFSPRIVITKSKQLVFDEFVPFRTIREGREGIAFVGDVEIPKERLVVHAALSLDDLNEEMKGHPRLEMTLERDGKELTAGTLEPGSFADLPDDYRVGFAGMRRWSEIDFSRRNYTHAVLTGLALLAAGLALWPIAAWRRW